MAVVIILPVDCPRCAYGNIYEQEGQISCSVCSKRVTCTCCRGKHLEFEGGPQPCFHCLNCGQRWFWKKRELILV